MTGPPVSSVPAVVAYLETAIQEQTATDPTPILLAIGDGPTPNLPNDVILIGSIHRTPSTATFIGSGNQFWLDEEYDVDVVVSTWSGNNDGLAATNRAWQLVAYVELAVRLDPSLGGLVNKAYPSLTDTLGPVFSDEALGMEDTVVVTIHVSNLN